MNRTPTADPAQPYAFRLTPAEWRSLIEDETFLRDPDNSYMPRRLMGVPVQIVPDHRPDPLLASSMVRKSGSGLRRDQAPNF